MTWVVVRVRGSVNVRSTIGDTMAMLHLHRTNHCTLVPETPSYKGMVAKVKDYVTWGEAETEALLKLLESRGRLPGDRPLEDSYVASNTKYKSVAELAQAMTAGEADITTLPGLKPVFRLHPPKGGYEGLKRAFSVGGALGYRRAAINDLIRRML